jgi:folate-binding protein YgfZ
MDATEPRSGRLTHLGILRFTGLDALTFLQGQLTNDTQRLAANRVVLAAYLNSQGRALALMHLLPHSSGTLAILPGELKQPIAERMRKYILRAKVKIDDPGESLVVSGYHGVQALAQAGLPVPAECGYAERDGLGVARVGHGTRYWVVAPPDAQRDGLEASALIERDWRLADIEAGLPQIYGATSEAFVAQMLNLDLLDGISFKKGCYTGQEIVARSQHLGRIKRRLFHLKLPHIELPHDPWRIGGVLSLSDGRHGRITEVIETDASIDALAVLSLEASPASEVPEAERTATATIRVPAVQVPLPYALDQPPADSRD